MPGCSVSWYSAWSHIIYQHNLWSHRLAVRVEVGAQSQFNNKFQLRVCKTDLESLCVCLDHMRGSCGGEGVWFGNLWVLTLLYEDDVGIFGPWPQLAAEWESAPLSLGPGFSIRNKCREDFMDLDVLFLSEGSLEQEMEPGIRVSL